MRELLQEELQAVCPLGIELDREIGKGSYGRVYSLKDCNRVFKVLDPAMSRTGKTLELKDYEQFKKELEYAEKITHLKNPYLLPIQGIYSCAIQPEDDEKRMIFMMLMPRRKNLEELAGEKIAAGAKPCEDDIIRIVSDLCRGLESLHQEKVVIEGKVGTIEKISIPGPLIHGDIKPGNVFVHDDSDGVSYYQLGDFGACFRCGNGWIPGQKLYTNFHYTAPEIHDKDIGPGYDVFSLGFMLYWWMNGWQHPEEARKARFQADFEQKFRLKNMSQELWQVFMKATKEAPQNRYASAAQLREALENARKARNARIQEKEKKEIEVTSKKAGEEEGLVNGVVDTLLVEILIWFGGKLIKKGCDKFIGKGKSKNTSAVVQTPKSLPTIQKGEKNFGNGLIYRGEIVDGKACGHGVLYCPDGGDFQGIWNNNGIDSSEEGTFHFSNGSFLRGQWSLVILEEDGYFGMMLDNERCGWGKQTYPSGGSYTGEFKNNVPSGRGSYCMKDGSCFTGNWDYFSKPELKSHGLMMDGQFWGHFEMHYATGGIYTGEFQNGHPAGNGVYTFDNGQAIQANWTHSDEQSSHFSGMLLNGRRCGWGQFAFDIGSCYRGEFKDGAPCGSGVYVAKDGAELQGVWSYAYGDDRHAYSGMVMNQMRNGWGELKLGDGCRYMGEFRNGEITGWGQHLDKKGRLLREGFWEDGCPVG